MPKVIWLGEDDLHPEGQAGPSFTLWNGHKFHKDVPVEVKNEIALAKARGNPFFKVIEDATADVVGAAAGVAKVAVKTGARAAVKVAGDVKAVADGD